jgi:hypothetical protein
MQNAKYVSQVMIVAATTLRINHKLSSYPSLVHIYVVVSRKEGMFITWLRWLVHLEHSESKLWGFRQRSLLCR